MVGLQWRIPGKMDDVGVPRTQETSEQVGRLVNPENILEMNWRLNLEIVQNKKQKSICQTLLEIILLRNPQRVDAKENPGSSTV